MTGEHPEAHAMVTSEQVAWLIECGTSPVRYYCSPGEWCDNPNHALKFPTEAAAKLRSAALHTLDPVRIVEHAWA